MSFVHTHVHSGYSLLDSMIRIDALVARVKELGQTAVSLTDHGTLAGAVKFTDACLKEGIKPLLGQEFYIASDSRWRKKYAKGEHAYSHLILLAKNDVGWRNLMRLSTLAYSEGFYRKPRIDHALLADHSEGLICTSACIGGDIAVHLIGGSAEEKAKTPFDPELAQAKIDWYFSVFGEDFFCEMQSYGKDYQEYVNDWYRSRVPASQLLATADCHYLMASDADCHDTLLCAGTYSRKSDPERWRFVADEFYLKSEAEMLDRFRDQECANTAILADRIDFVLPLRKQFYMPELPADIKGEDTVGTFRQLCIWGLTEHLVRTWGDCAPEDFSSRNKPYWDRLEMEMNVYERAGYVEYALLLWDLMRWCGTRGIFTGDGRGSGVGSLVLFALGITKVDPIERACPFERFINAGRLERFAPPDVDLDFPRSRRAEVIEYLRDRYGAERVCQIGTYATLGPSALVRQLATPLGIDPSVVKRLCDPIPSGETSVQGAGAAAESTGLSLQDIYDQSAEFRAAVDGLGETGQDLMRYGAALAKLGTHASKHASGIIIADRPVAELLPLMRSNNDEPMAQFDMFDIEALGLIKFDILGLKTLDVLDYVERSIRVTDPDFRLRDVDLDDEDSYRLMQTGRTTGIFQAEGGGFGKLLPQIRPTTVEQLSAITSLCRPGPVNAGITDSYVRRSNGQEPVVYPIPALEPILRNNFGLITYQEDIMAIAHQLAGYTLAEADDLRKIMGKKQREKMPYHEEKFMSGLMRNGVDYESAYALWEEINKMAEYVFNRGHAMAYSYLTAKCAWAKAHYPAYFIAATMTEEAMGDSGGLPALLSDARHLGVNVLPPDINESQDGFVALNKDVILAGLRSIKGVGEKAVEAILTDRQARGPFTSLEEFESRLPAKSCNALVRRALERAGAFDAMQGRKRLLTSERLMEEFELFGFFLSGHPIARARANWGEHIMTISAVMTDTALEKYRKWRDGKHVIVWGNKERTLRVVVTKLDKRKSKRGGNALLYFCEIEDETGTAKMFLHSGHLEKLGIDNLKNGSFLEVVGRKADQRTWAGYIEPNTLKVVNL